MTSIRMQVLNQICATPNRTAKELADFLSVPVNQVRLSIYTLEGAGKVGKVDEKRPFRYAFAIKPATDPITPCWRPKRDLVDFFVGMRSG